MRDFKNTNNSQDNIALSFLKGGGEMGELTRAYDWSQTPVRDPKYWPQSLRTTVSNLLNSKFPMFLWWGEDMIQFYNDAYRPSLGNEGKHPKALGQRGIECWPEIWSIIFPLIEQVKSTGQPTWNENLLVPIFRNGKIEDVYWTFSYSQVLNDDGDPAGVLVTCMETTEAVLSRKQLEESEKRFQDLVMQAPVAIAVFRGENFVAEIVNDYYLKLVDKRRSEFLNTPLFESLPLVQSSTEPLAKEVVKTGQPYYGREFEVPMNRNGKIESAYFNFIYSPLTESDGTRNGFIVVATEVTEQVESRKKLEEVQSGLEEQVKFRTEELQLSNVELATTNEELQKSTHQLARSNEELSQFAYAASHDLQEPLRKIQIFSDRILHLKTLPCEADEWAAKINQAAARMTMLIKSLLEFSRLVTPEETFAKVDLAGVIKDILKDFELELNERRSQVEVHNLPVVTASELQMQQLFYNLLSNALKFVPGEVIPRIEVNCQTVSFNELRKYLHKPPLNKEYHDITISDNGIGFDKQYSEHIFEIFKRLHAGAQFKGSGIGLALCKRIVTNHGGYIRADSTVGKGSTFHVFLPKDS